jgi:hypothetical protein
MPEVFYPFGDNEPHGRLEREIGTLKKGIMNKIDNQKERFP